MSDADGENGRNRGAITEAMIEQALARRLALSPDDDHKEAELLARALSGDASAKAGSDALLARDPDWAEAFRVVNSIEAGEPPKSAEARDAGRSSVADRASGPAALRSRGPRWSIRAAAAVIAIAAGVLLLVRGPVLRTGSLPRYALESLGGDQAVRAPVVEGAAKRTLETYAPASLVELNLRPETAVEGEIQLESFIAAGEGLRPWKAPAERLPGGVIRIRGLAKDLLPLPPGEVRLVFVIGKHGELPSDAHEVAQLLEGSKGSGSPPARWIVLEHRLRLSP